MRRIGSLRDYAVDIQVITATNRSLEQLVQQGSFRQDLFYRLNTLRIGVPPLRERLGDSVLLANHFLGIFSRKYNKPELSLNADSASLIATYAWPGNVRELRNMMEQSVLHSDGPQVLPEILTFPSAINTSPPNQTVDLPSNRLPEQPLQPDNSLGDRPDDRLADAERLLIEQTLNAVNGNISETARRLGITRDRLRYRLKKYGFSE